jgi:hypothetical protein
MAHSKLAKKLLDTITPKMIAEVNQHVINTVLKTPPYLHSVGDEVLYKGKVHYICGRIRNGHGCRYKIKTIKGLIVDNISGQTHTWIHQHDLMRYYNFDNR